jgi:hypothetical protein
MTNNLLQIKIKERLNKLASFDYDNIECWQIMEAFNKAQLEWVRRQVHGANIFKEGDESSKMNIDDLQILQTDTTDNPGAFTIVKKDGYYESNTFPANYLYYKRVSVKSIATCCPSPRKMVVYLAEVADVDNLLRDNFKSPSARWGETFNTIAGNKMKIYTNNEFDLTQPVLFYYRKPKEVLITNCINPSTGGTIITEQLCEFKDDIVEILIDETCAVLAGDIESTLQYQRNKDNSNTNT